jgi:low temperature requirement protein LtrA
MAIPLLRKRVPGRHAPVTSLELFFDLVFVFAVTQVSHSLLEHLTWLGAVQALLLMMCVWWAWIYTTWITNWLNPENPAVRLLLLVLMGLGLILSTSLSRAFEDRGLTFACAYAAFQVGRTLFMVWASQDRSLRTNFVRVAVWLTVSAIFWIGGGLADEGGRLGLWAVALAIEYASPAAGFWVPGLGRTATREWTVEGAHIAERCGLFIIICLGESILVTGATVAGLDWTPTTLAAFAVAFVGSLAMWWIYFSAHADLAAHAIAESSDPGRIARTAYTYIHMLLVAGTIVAAAGDELVLSHPTGHTSPAVAAVVMGGPGLFLLGALLFKASVFGTWAPSRLAGLVLLAALAPFSLSLAPLVLSAATTGVLVIVGAWDTVLVLRLAARQTSAMASAAVSAGGPPIAPVSD